MMRIKSPGIVTRASSRIRQLEATKRAGVHPSEPTASKRPRRAKTPVGTAPQAICQAKPDAAAPQPPTSQVPPASMRSARSGTVLLDLASGPYALEKATLLRRPSARNKSPYVADAVLATSQREVIVHCPNLNMGGKCVAGSTLLVRPATDKNGRLIGADATGQYGTPKCEYICQLVWCNEDENAEMTGGGVWVGGHPSLGEQIAKALIAERLVSGLDQYEHCRREVTGVAGCDMRSDFVLEGETGTTVVEVKTVVDTDYHPLSSRDDGNGKLCVWRADAHADGRYERGGIFPWGSGAQKGPDGEKVVSARAIKHVRELTAIAKGSRRLESGSRASAVVLFIISRADANHFRPNFGACPSFARYLREAHAAGVRVVARRVRWGVGTGGDDRLGCAYDDGEVPVRLGTGTNGLDSED